MILILDSSAFLSGFMPENAYTVQEVLDELKDEKIKLRINLSLNDGSLKLQEPGVEEIQKVKKAARETGDIAKLSETDVKLLSIALYFRNKNAVLVTDDYSIQNLACKLGIKIAATTEGEIEKVFTWKNVCRGCGRKFDTEYKGRCSFCESELKRVRIFIEERHR